MTLVLAGMSHRTAPLELRERLAFSRDACAEGLGAIVDGSIVREALIISTCNRVEILAEIDPVHAEDWKNRVGDFLAAKRSVPLDDFGQHLYSYSDAEAVRHVFRVASSLDSMVMGEPQILGQVREAYAVAVEAGAAGRVIHRLMHHAFRIAKRVRTETGIAARAVSVSYTAVELGRKIFNSLDGCTVLIVGAGEMAELAVQHLAKAGASRVMVANRTPETAAALAAKFSGEAVAYEKMAAHLAAADVVICSTSAPEYIITPAMTREALALRRNRPLFLIDISVPRNIDPAVSQSANLFLFDVDDLEAVVVSNLRERGREAAHAEQLVEAETRRFVQGLRQLDLGEKVGAMKKQFQEIARSEMARRRGRLGELSPEQERAVEALLISTVNKISHPVIQQMRRSVDAEEGEFTDIWRDGLVAV